MIFHVDLDAFFASIEQRDNPVLRDKPVLVGRTDPQGKRCFRGVVATCSYEARRYGISSGMPIFQALKLCPHAIVVEGHFEKYRQASQKMYAIFDRYTFQVEPTGIDEAYLSFYGFEDFYNQDFLGVAKQIKNAIYDEIGITASVGIAKNKLVAKMASGFQKPDGLTLVINGKEKEFLNPFPIGKLFGVGFQTEKKLKSLGIQTVGDLQNKTLSFFKNTFGKYGETIWAWGSGIDERVVTPPPPAKSVGRSITLPSNSDNPQYLKATLFYLCQKIARQLHGDELEGRCLTTIIRYADFSTYSHQKILKSPISSAFIIYHHAQELFDHFWTTKKLRLIGVRVSHFDTQRQLQFDFNAKEKLPKMEKSLEKIREKFGFWSIYPASLSVVTRQEK